MLDTRLLTDLGLTPKESEMVVHMANALKTSRKGYFEAPSLASDLGIPREKIYTYLKTLEEKGVLETIGARPKRFCLRPLDDALEGLLQRRRESVEQALSQLQRAIQEAKSSEYASLLPRISVLRDATQYVRAMIDIVLASQDAMIIARTSALLLPWARSDEPEDLLATYRSVLLERARSGKITVDYFIPFHQTRREILARCSVSGADARRAISNMRDFCVDRKHPNISVKNIPRFPAISLIMGGGRVAIGFSSREETRTAKGILVESGDLYQFMSTLHLLLLAQPEVEITPQMIDEVEVEVQSRRKGAMEGDLDRMHREGSHGG